jgi:hypothetical protein
MFAHGKFQWRSKRGPLLVTILYKIASLRTMFIIIIIMMLLLVNKIVSGSVFKGGGGDDEDDEYVPVWPSQGCGRPLRGAEHYGSETSKISSAKSILQKVLAAGVSYPRRQECSKPCAKYSENSLNCLHIQFCAGTFHRCYPVIALTNKINTKLKL